MRQTPVLARNGGRHTSQAEFDGIDAIEAEDQKRELFDGLVIFSR